MSQRYGRIYDRVWTDTGTEQYKPAHWTLFACATSCPRARLMLSGVYDCSDEAFALFTRLPVETIRECWEGLAGHVMRVGEWVWVKHAADMAGSETHWKGVAKDVQKAPPEMQRAFIERYPAVQEFMGPPDGSDALAPVGGPIDDSVQINSAMLAEVEPAVRAYIEKSGSKHMRDRARDAFGALLAVCDHDGQALLELVRKYTGAGDAPWDVAKAIQAANRAMNPYGNYKTL